MFDGLKQNKSMNHRKANENYWLDELDSLGIKAKTKNKLNDTYELGNLTENIKQTMFQDYKTAYSRKENGNQKSEKSNQ